MFIGIQIDYTMDPLAGQLPADRLRFIHSRFPTFVMQQQPTPTDEEWFQLMQLFRRTETSSATTVEETRSDDEQEMGDSDQDPENLETILTEAIQGVEIFDSEESRDVRQDLEGGQQIQSQSTSGGVIGSSSLHHQVIDPQGNIIMNQENQISSSVPQCAGCGMTSTPEWRRGPTGPRTLCNACGLTYAKILRARARGEEEGSTSDEDGDDGFDSSENQEEEEEGAN